MTKRTRHIDYKFKPYLDLTAMLCVSLLVILFINTGLGKIIDHEIFKLQMSKQPLPIWSKSILVYMLPFLEIGIIVLLLFKTTRQKGFIIATLLMIAYSIYAYLAYKEVYGYVICACGKIFQKMNWQDHYRINIALTLIAITGLIINKISHSKNTK